MKTYTKSSLIVSTYNWPQALRLCLLSIGEQSVLPCEVIIADDGSTEQTTALIESLRPHFPVPLIHVWHPDEGFQLSKIRNKAIAQCSYEYVIQIDGDLLLHKDFIKDHLMIAQKGTFVAGSRVLMNQPLSEKMLVLQKTKIHPFQTGLANFCNRFSINWLCNYFADRYKTKDIFALRGCNMAFWKSDLIRINGYNELFHSWGREDNEIAVRLFNAGLKKRAIKFGGVVYHLHHKEAERAKCHVNDEYLSYAMEQKAVSCALGLSQYLDVLAPVAYAEKEFEI